MRRKRPGYTIVEVTVAFGVLAVLLSTIAYLGYWSIRQRIDIEARQAALELVSNVLEQARSMPLETVTAAWAAKQELPKDYESLLPRGRMTVTVKVDGDGVRQVSAVVVWYPDEIDIPRSVQLQTFFAPRSRSTKGGQP